MKGLLILLKALEWSGTTQGQGTGFMSSGGDGPNISCCPNCRGIDPDDKNRGHFVSKGHGHRSSCTLDRFIQELS